MFYLANITQGEKELCVTASSEITEDQYREIKNLFNFTSFYHTCRSAKNMVLESACDLENYLNYLKKDVSGYNDLEINNFLITGNKLLISFLSFMKTFFDIISHAISQRNPAKLEDFQKFNSKIYDIYFGYRFLSRLRNYVIHYDMPLTTITNSVISGIEMGCNRDLLLKFDGWSKVSAEIEQLPEFVDVKSYIVEAKQAILSLYLKSLETIAKDAVTANHKMTEMCRRYGVDSPVILIVDKNKKEPEIEKLPIYLMNSFFEDLNQHPNYKIKITNPEVSDDQL